MRLVAAQRRAAAREQEKDERAAIRFSEKIENRARGGETFFVGHRMARDEQLQAGDRPRRQRRHNEDSLGGVFGRENFGQAFGHARRRLAESDHAQRGKFGQVHFPALDDEAAALALDGGADGAAGVDGGERLVENLARE